jgi:aspartyl-tRNA(Asn)/glutamyl-tRNA(Gln) amidotransferase subunit A
LTELSRLVAARTVSPVEIVDALLARIGALNGSLASYVTVCEDTARTKAATAERDLRAGRRRGPLDGLPIAHKDIVWTKGVRTTAHSRALADFVPTDSATFVDRLERQGMILLGKTNTGEFACGTTDLFGTPTNPWSATRYTGGSSNGSANAVAAGLAIAATGTDTGGSVRVPASFCGVVGLKPTYGRVSRKGVITLSWSMDHVGTLTRTVSDAALLLEHMAGYDPLDRTSSRRPVPSYAVHLVDPVKGRVIGIPRKHFYESLHPEVDRALRTALNHLEELGAHLEEIALEGSGDLEFVGPLLYRVEAFAQHARRLRERGQDYGRRARQKIAAGAFFSAADYLQATQIRETWNRNLEGVLRRVDAIVTPTLPFPAFPIETQSAGPPDTSWGTRHFNLSGHPAITVPCGFSSDGLPIGMQIVGNLFDEKGVLAIAHAFQQMTDWHQRRPPVGEKVGA